MKKQFLNLGKALSKAEQKQISGGKTIYYKPCNLPNGTPCPSGGWCYKGVCGPVNPN